MADTIFSYPNLPLGMNMYHLQVELSAVPNYPICPKLPHLGVIWDSIIYTLMYQQQHELRESFTQYKLFTTQMYIKS